LAAYLDTSFIISLTYDKTSAARKQNRRQGTSFTDDGVMSRVATRSELSGGQRFLVFQEVESGLVAGRLGGQALDHHIETRRGQREVLQHVPGQLVEILLGFRVRTLLAAAQAGSGDPQPVRQEGCQRKVEP
jgi:hypothetical protein